MGTCLFERAHHRRIATVLEALDGSVLAANSCFFGGGTAIVLRFGEFRESADIDFLVSDLPGYSNLRQLVRGAEGIRAITRSGANLTQAREARVDQYGIRTVLVVDGHEIKFEIISEGRIRLEAPGVADQVCGVPTLTSLDLAASKLLANSDRWADDGTCSRDLIDLAMMQPGRVLLQRAIDKAKLAYGASVERDLAGAIGRIRSRLPEHRLERCMDAMCMTVPPALVWRRIKALLPSQGNPL